jgi:SNF2 family DNA or RNA helicase
VTAGYELPNRAEVARASDFKPVPDSAYLKYRNSFYHLSPERAEDYEQLVPLENIPEFFTHDLVRLRARFHVVLVGQAKNIEIIEAPYQPRVQVAIDDDGWLDFQIDYTVGGYELPHDFFEDVVNAEHVHPDETTWIAYDARRVYETRKQLQILNAAKTAEGYRIPITQFLALEDAIDNIGGVRQVSIEYQRFLDAMSGYELNPGYRLPLGHEDDLRAHGITLRPYQRAGIEWLYWLMSHHLHGILADDMGLGKTVQAILALRLRYESSGSAAHSLIVCPKSVVGHWLREIERAYPQIQVYAYTGHRRNRNRFTSRSPTIFITTYATMSRDVELLQQTPFLAVILDEGTRIKNPDTQRYAAAKKLNAAHRIVLSGTPIENRPLELWSLFNFLMEGHLGGYGHFLTEYEQPIQNEDAVAARSLAHRIRPFILRRLKEDVAQDLPEKITMKHWCSLTDEQKALYRQIQDRYVAPVRASLLKGEYVNVATSIFPVLTKLKQVCDHPALISENKTPLLGRSEKFDFIAETVERAVKGGESIVLFSHFLGSLDLFEALLREKGIRYVRIDGSTRNRQALIDAFNASTCAVALCSLMAAGHGINLTSASNVIHVDRWWNPAIEDQATDRVHRIGQTKTVYVYKVLTEGTLEEKIDALLARKRGISDRVIGAATDNVKSWTRDELLDVLKPIRG